MGVPHRLSSEIQDLRGDGARRFGYSHLVNVLGTWREGKSRGVHQIAVETEHTYQCLNTFE